MYKDILRQRAKKNASTKLLKVHGINAVILRRVYTEKTAKLEQDHKKVTFLVNTSANKNDVKTSVEKLFGVAPIAVNIITTPKKQKERRVTRFYGKKAIVEFAGEIPQSVLTK